MPHTHPALHGTRQIATGTQHPPLSREPGMPAADGFA